MASHEEVLLLNQEHVDRAVHARELRRQAREKGDLSLEKALAYPINTMAGDSPPKLAKIGDKDESVCFGSILKNDDERFYVGKYPVRDLNRDLLVISWKSRIGALFYKSSIKKPLGLKGVSRITFGKPNQVTDVEEKLYLELEERIQNLTRRDEAEVSDAVLDELERGSSGSLKEIIQTIHASQYEIISAPRGGLHIIQGAPGTGKTVVGVHRASWLLFPGNDEDLRAEKTLIVGPNRAFIHYIENVVPSLGDENIAHRDLSQLGPVQNVVTDELREVAKIKGDLRMKELLLQGLRDRIKLPEVDVEYVVPNLGIRLVLSHISISEKIETSWDEMLRWQGRLGLGTLRGVFRTWLLNIVTREIDARYQGTSRASQSRVSLKESDLDSLTEKIWPAIGPTAFLRDFLGSQGRIINAARNLDFSVKDLTLLVRKNNTQISKELWTTSDVALLDYLSSCIYGIDVSDQFDYIIVDEAQDLTPMQIDSIKRRSTGGDILLMGDLAQSTGPWVYKSWDEISGCLGLNIARFDELEFGYRVPKQIFDFAEKVLSHIDPRLQAPRLVRDVSERPLVFVEQSRESLLGKLIDFVGKIPTSGRHIGLIAADSLLAEVTDALRSAQILFQVLENNSLVEGLNLVPVSRQKGLEFDDVIIFEPREIIQVLDIGLSQLYVALTRSLRRLAIFASHELPRELREFAKVEEMKRPSLTPGSVPVPERVDIDSRAILSDIEGYLAVKGMSKQKLVQILREGI